MEQLRVAAPEAHVIAAPEPAALPAVAEGGDEDATEGVRVLTPPAPPEPEPEPEPESEQPHVVAEVIEVVEETVVVVDGTIVVEEVTEETVIVPADPMIEESVDDLFARIRAGRAEEVAKAEDLLADADVESVGGTEPLTDTGTPESGDEEDSGEADSAPDVFDQRSAALAPLEVSLGRKLRRILADDQNEVLDRLRQGAKLPDLDGLVGGADAHAGRYAEGARPDLAAAAKAGAELVGGVTDAPPPDLDDVVTDLGTAMSGPLRERLAACLADSAGDVDEATELVRAAYREWKTQRIDATASDALLAGFNRGAFAVAPAGCSLRWLVAPDQPPCPDADDNALAGPVERGTAFPTGHLHAPAHPGCRCQVVIAPR